MVALARHAPLVPELIESAARLESIADEWEALLSRSDQDEPTRSPLWLGAWWRCFGGTGGRRLRVVAFRQGRRLVGVVPLAARPVWVAPGVRMRRLDLLPSGEEEADEICSDYLGPVAERGLEQPVAEGLAQLLDDGGLGRWDELVMPAMSFDGAMIPLLYGAFERLGAIAFDVTGGAPYIPLPPSWSEYLGQLSGSRRRMVTSSLRAFDQWTGGHADLRVAGTSRELDQGVRILRDLHAARWQADGKAGVFASERFAAFHDEVMPELLSRGALELMWLCVRKEPVAALYNLVWGNKVYFYQSGRRPDLPKGLRVGVVLHAMAIKRSIELGRREYDFLNGSSRYKQELALAVRPIAKLRVVRRGPAARARRMYERATSIVRAVRAGRAP